MTVKKFIIAHFVENPIDGEDMSYHRHMIGIWTNEVKGKPLKEFQVKISYNKKAVVKEIAKYVFEQIYPILKLKNLESWDVSFFQKRSFGNIPGYDSRTREYFKDEESEAFSFGEFTEELRKLLKKK